ncbi:YbhB/YbcL family Raf kinase inhibitor-like protein [Maritalea porphyrae]|uniref:Phospholipid-binding protein n=1 Tax=Maritalea porphyrae TaxID=880732 RepID=A0ABQ5UPH7_9HYPH|nr:YbhB/YbcL family Raf kinase inhibitor-like protein [Maritalea porphyrae]GLQ17193.1 hypothetical protein GCM10007879_14420 [Maritalea porphyrae]
MLRILLLMFLIGSSSAMAFEVKFEWGDTPACNTGWPDVINSPAFEIVDVPDGTKKLKFFLKDLDAPGFTHGGGTVTYNSDGKIAAGAFTYKGPCPPNGQHRYQWTVTPFDRYGDKLGKATAKRLFPEK